MKNYPDEHANATPTNYRTFDHGPRKGETIIFLHGGNAAGWTWYGQVELMPDRHVLTPDLLGYAGRADEEWPGFAGAADDIAELIRTRAIEGRAHVVGLSLGGFVATYLLHRHPEVVRSCLMSGSALAGYSRVERAVVGAQVGLWRQRWYWAVQAALFRIPADSREQYIRDASAASHRSNRAMLRETLNHRLPTGDFDFAGPGRAASPARFWPLRRTGALQPPDGHAHRCSRCCRGRRPGSCRGYIMRATLSRQNFSLGWLPSTRTQAGGIVLEMVLAGAVVGTSVVLYPMLRKHGPSLALGMSVCTP